MQFPGKGRPPLGVILDTDLGNSIDDALALALLYGLDGKTECRVVSVSVSKPNLHAAALCEVIARFYSGTVSGAFNSFSRTLPVGLAETGKKPEDTPMLMAPLERKDPDGKPLYNHGIEKLTDTAEAPALIRNAFTAQYDQNSVAVLAGPATNLAGALSLPGVKDLVAAKAKFLVMSGGAFPSGDPDFNIQADIPAARSVLADWPTPLVVCGAEIGAELQFPGESIEKDFAWSQAHPVVDAYRAYKTMPYDAPARDMAAVLYAVRPGKNYFKLSGPGTISVTDDGRTTFTPSAQGTHRYLIVDPAQKELVIQTFREIASAKPVPRQPRRRPPVQEKKEPPKPAEAKPRSAAQ